MIEKITYQCSFCGFTCKRKDDMEAHEKSCRFRDGNAVSVDLRELSINLDLMTGTVSDSPAVCTIEAIYDTDANEYIRASYPSLGVFTRGVDLGKPIVGLTTHGKINIRVLSASLPLAEMKAIVYKEAQSIADRVCNTLKQPLKKGPIK